MASCSHLKLTDVTDRIRVATESLHQELIDAEGPAFIGPAAIDVARPGNRISDISHAIGCLTAHGITITDGSAEILILPR